ncbi:MAG: helicase C-terminal domain-containing protein [Chloroflexota bacterium]|nr:helicase C-terminal domain-containing protein [Chloroflexota bacterium]
MPQTYVALDLETTGLDADRDAIIEVGAVKFHDDEVLDTFSTFVNPGRPIPLQITELTGICDGDVVGAPGLHDVLSRLARFVGQQPIVGHSVNFDLSFLRRHSQSFENELLDTFELASVLLPHAERYSLGALAKMLGIELEQAHRALDDAQATHRLFRILLRRAAGLSPRLLEEIVRHGERGRWAAARFFRDALDDVARHPLEQHARPGPAVTPEGPLFAAAGRARPLQPTAEREPLVVEQLAALLERGGAFEAHFPSYEHRPQQVAMLRGIARAISRGEHLLVEAPTGVGKSLAYLIPAVYWAVQNSERVVISTNTINLQEQLYNKDLPDLVRALPLEFHAAVLKGRSHYLCPARLQAARRRGARSPDEARVLAKVLVWLPEAADGDGDELFLPNPVERVLWRRLSADHDGCDLERCRHFQKGNCHFYNARRAAESAHLIIVNHALLLADVAVQNRALPEYKYLIVDEAHHLEAATTNGLSFETDRASMRRSLFEVGRMDQKGLVTGLLAEVIGRCQKAQLPGDTMEQIELFIGKVGLAAGRAMRQLDFFFDCLEEFVEEHRQDRRGQYAFRLRVTSGLRVQPAWESVEIAWDDANAPLAGVVNGLERLARGLGELEAFDVPDSDDLQAQILGVARQVGTARGQVHKMITEPDASLIYWLESDASRDRLRLHAAPLHVGPLVEEYLFHKKESMVLTSATLRTGCTFDFLRERLNAWEADELVVGSPFDYENSTLVYLVDDIPEPGKQGYQQAVEQGMAALFRATEGRALALFTSYSQLRATLRAIRAPLSQAGITVQAQGQGVSRGQLLENFRTGERRVLLGTRSFWEGVDVPGEALSCLAIAKLPFSVPSDPIFAARSETFDQPFLEYAVPGTILRFLQGFGRLIRTRTDRGVVVIFDKRLLTKSYGSLFIESLPDPTVRRGSLALLPRTAAAWLEER